jgi:hypothetical protein
LNGEGSDSQSKGLAIIVVESVAETLYKFGITKEKPNQEELDVIIDNINGPIRKCAHATEYFVLTRQL